MEERPIVKNVAFREYTTSNAFVMTLSKNQSDALADVVESKEHGCRLGGQAVQSLTRRGLIEVAGSKEEKSGNRVFGTYLIYRPTLAGKLMYRLLHEAGLIDSLEHPMLTCPIDCTEDEWVAMIRETA